MFPHWAIPAPRSHTSRARTSPLARKIAAERGVDLATVTGTGPGGRIVERDVAAAAGGGRAAASVEAPPPKPRQPVPGARPGTRVPLTKIR